MSLSKLFEALDEKVFTPELKESLEAHFNEAVEAKAASIASTRIEEEIDNLSEKAEEHINFLNEKAEEYVGKKQQEMVESLDKYLDRIVNEFVSDAKEALDESVKTEKADLIIEAFESMLIASGVKVANIMEANSDSSTENKLAESIEKYDSLVEEVIALKDENEKLLKEGVIAEMKEGLTIVESEKFEKLADLVEFSKDESYVTKLETIKESVKGNAKASDENVNENKKIEEENKPEWAHLI